MKVLKISHNYNFDNNKQKNGNSVQNIQTPLTGEHKFEPSFSGKSLRQKILDFLFGDPDEEILSQKKKAQQRTARPVHSQKKKTTTQKPPVRVIKQTPVKGDIEPVKVPAITEIKKTTVNPRYELLDEYERITKSRTEFRNRTRGRQLTNEEILERNNLRKEWTLINSQLIPKHQSILLKKSAEDFNSEAEKKDYIMKYVLPRMSASEESAFDALDMFEQFGFRADYQSGINTTITKLCQGIKDLPKEAMNDTLLKRFLEVFEKFANNQPSKHPDDEELVSVLSDFMEKGVPVSENTLVNGINLMKKIACQSWVHERLNYELMTSFDAKFKDSNAVNTALEDLGEAVNGLKYRLGADDR